MRMLRHRAGHWVANVTQLEMIEARFESKPHPSQNAELQTRFQNLMTLIFSLAASIKWILHESSHLTPCNYHLLKNKLKLLFFVRQHLYVIMCFIYGHEVVEGERRVRAAGFASALGCKFGMENPFQSSFFLSSSWPLSRERCFVYVLLLHGNFSEFNCMCFC